ncbi:MAG: hypothetical protein WD873_09250 [Candidatus Hydrogenedentales bacterium]
MSNFQKYAAFYDLLYRDKDYAAEAAYVAGTIRSAVPGARSILELGSGTGRHGRLLAGLGFDETTIGRVLNHARVTVTGRHYNQHAYLDEKRAALAAWDRELLAIVTGKRDKAKVVAHRPRRRA